jgi:hypothetical protein
MRIGGHTVVTAEDKVEDRLESKNAQEIPRNARHPPRVHVLSGNASLKHALELDSERERQFHCVVNIVSEPFAQGSHDVAPSSGTY